MKKNDSHFCSIYSIQKRDLIELASRSSRLFAILHFTSGDSEKVYILIFRHQGSAQWAAIAFSGKTISENHYYFVTV